MGKPELRVFVSHTPADAGFVEALGVALAEGGLSISANPKPGDGEAWMTAIEDALEEADAFLFVVSPRYANSRWTQFEMGVAVSRAMDSADLQLVPVLRGGTTWHDVPKPLRGRTVIDGNEMSVRELAAEIAGALLPDTRDDESSSMG